MDIVANTYRLEKEKVEDEVIIKSTKSKAPKDFQAFLQNGENKNKFMDLPCETISSSPHRALIILETSVI